MVDKARPRTIGRHAHNAYEFPKPGVKIKLVRIFIVGSAEDASHRGNRFKVPVVGPLLTQSGLPPLPAGGCWPNLRPSGRI